MAPQCAVKFCEKYCGSIQRSYFKFPSEPKILIQWISACKCHDLAKHFKSLTTSHYRVCHLHFEESTMNFKKNRIVKGDAVPSLFLEKKEISQMFSAIRPSMKRTLDAGEKPTISASFEGVMPTPIDLDDDDESQLTDSMEVPCEAILSITNSDDKSTQTETHNEDRGIQTEQRLSWNTPKIQKMRKKLHSLHKKIYSLTKRLESVKAKSQEQQKEAFSGITAGHFIKFCDRFLPKGVAAFAKLSAAQNHRKPQGRRYNDEFMQTCLDLYLAAPQAYKHLCHLFSLPSKRTLSKFAKKNSCGESASTEIHSGEGLPWKSNKSLTISSVVML